MSDEPHQTDDNVRTFKSVKELFDWLDLAYGRKPWWYRLRITVEVWASDIKWWFLWRFHPRHRYHIVRTGLKPGYHDTDKRIEAAVITLFKACIEQDKIMEIVDTEDPENKHYWDSVKTLYSRVKDIDVNQVIDYDETTEILCEIVRLRRVLWI